MRPVNEKLAADLLEAGKQEFLEKGFQGASMRGIASRLSVTTVHCTAITQIRNLSLMYW